MKRQHLVMRGIAPHAVCCSVLQCAAMFCNKSQCVSQRVAVYKNTASCDTRCGTSCNMLQCVVLCCRVLQCGPVCCHELRCMTIQYLAMRGAARYAACCSDLQCVAIQCRVLQRVAVYKKTVPYECAVWYIMQCIAVCCRLLQCVAVCYTKVRCVAVSCSLYEKTLPHDARRCTSCSESQCIAVSCSVFCRQLQCIALS